MFFTPIGKNRLVHFMRLVLAARWNANFVKMTRMIYLYFAVIIPFRSHCSVIFILSSAEAATPCSARPIMIS